MAGRAGHRDVRSQRLLPVAAAVAGAAAIGVGVHQGLVHVAPGYEGTIVTGWGRTLNHEERLLAWLGALGVAGAVGSLRWRRLAVLPAATGGVVLCYALRAVATYALDPGLYVEVSASGGPTRFVLGAEPFLLVAGGALLVVAAVRGWRATADGTTDGDAPPTPSSRDRT
ncbi:hypothetical protein [Haloplanus halophilus]|uniref:hypothetical protein n=1 Tax=Haloplanus halophilus TaxID=2949993 RepID=UPI00203CE765|nr:hypothetical protein [Haloplanus sp. GDY1]